MMRWTSGCKLVAVIVCCILSGCGSDAPAPVTPAEYEAIKVMTYNILYTTSNEESVKALQEAAADIIGMQETSPSRLQDLARRLKYYHHSFANTTANLSDQDTGILSRFPITGFFDDGVLIQVNPDLTVAVFSVHLSPYPYEPYDFRDGLITTAEQAIASAGSVRLPEINPVIEQISDLIDQGIPVFLTGDFNEPSHFDWTEGTAALDLHFGKVVEWPVSKAVTDAGMVDAYRLKFPIAQNFPGITWTTWESEDEVYDRIDIIYHTDVEEITLKDIRLVGGTEDNASIKVAGYPSDHYSVVATYTLNN